MKWGWRPFLKNIEQDSSTSFSIFFKILQLHWATGSLKNSSQTAFHKPSAYQP
jgi:hypothetical protein